MHIINFFLILYVHCMAYPTYQMYYFVLQGKGTSTDVVDSVEVGLEADREVLGKSEEDRNKSVSFSLGSGSYENIEEQNVEDPTELTFQEISIIDTETRTESRSSSQYTLYVIEVSLFCQYGHHSSKSQSFTVM